MQTKTLDDVLAEDLSGTVIVLRGGPGTGKGEVAAAIVLAKGAIQFSADAHREANAPFSWEKGSNQLAHDACLRAFADHAAHWTAPDTIVVANTHVTAVEAAPYMALALAYGYRSVLVTLEANLETALARTKDRLPPAKVREAHRRVAAHTLHIPPTWRHYVVRIDHPHKEATTA